ncbi:MAG: hypothetical protein MZV63_66270 [Marinilabiliales bacterium]|nr:hypothetical protein [Marinilabiliales bacterium]
MQEGLLKEKRGAFVTLTRRRRPARLRRLSPAGQAARRDHRRDGRRRGQPGHAVRSPAPGRDGPAPDRDLRPRTARARRRSRGGRRRPARHHRLEGLPQGPAPAPGPGRARLGQGDLPAPRLPEGGPGPRRVEKGGEDRGLHRPGLFRIDARGNRATSCSSCRQRVELRLGLGLDDVVLRGRLGQVERLLEGLARLVVHLEGDKRPAELEIVDDVFGPQLDGLAQGLLGFGVGALRDLAVDEAAEGALHAADLIHPPVPAPQGVPGEVVRLIELEGLVDLGPDGLGGVDLLLLAEQEEPLAVGGRQLEVAPGVVGVGGDGLLGDGRGLGVHLLLAFLDVLLRRRGHRDDVGEVDHGPRRLPERFVVLRFDLQGLLVVLEGLLVVEQGEGFVAHPDVVGGRLGQDRPGQERGQ